MNEALITIMLGAATGVVVTGAIAAILFFALLTWQMIEDRFL
jgi:hypothetical protein